MPVLAHQGGWDEILFVALPLLVLFVIRWLSRRGEEEDKGDTDSA
jgi:hypothetical protein